MAGHYALWKYDAGRMLPAGAGGLEAAKAFLLTQGIWAVTMFRMGGWLRTLPAAVRFPLSLMFTPVHKLVECLSGIEIPSSVQAGPGLYIGHFGGIVLHGRVRLGSNVNLSQGVTIGIGGSGVGRGVPTIGSRVYIGPGAKVFGPITIGDDCIIGANAVVSHSIPPRSVVAGIPGRVLRKATKSDISQVIFGRE